MPSSRLVASVLVNNEGPPQIDSGPIVIAAATELAVRCDVLGDDPKRRARQGTVFDLTAHPTAACNQLIELQAHTRAGKHLEELS